MRTRLRNLLFIPIVFTGLAFNPNKTHGQTLSQSEYIVVFLTPSENDSLSVTEKQTIENNHLRNIGRLSENGILVNAGPFQGGGELLLLNTDTRKDTELLLKKDPMIHNGLLTFEILSLDIRKGGICDPVFPYEMITYSFIRYSPANQIAGYKTDSDFEMKRIHQKHLNGLITSGDVILEGIFPGNDGGILIYKGKNLDSRIDLDPAIQEGYLKTDKKTIWLNKGSFCEN